MGFNYYDDGVGFVRVITMPNDVVVVSCPLHQNLFNVTVPPNTRYRITNCGFGATQFVVFLEYMEGPLDTIEIRRRVNALPITEYLGNARRINFTGPVEDN
ncbi:hypothetical protein MM326_02145 [Alkalihalobacillus sp. LMS6]|uniref:hypothetical protein n=1 Tax=Bacillaceae TaxID=186817 RepID=UPI000C06F8E3|nr:MULTISPECIES: hypothetical protein [Bacillaceae]UTR06853.1 hypothetical protein MM326_02145 [Alkalihalobacillus sp. LMS6]